MAIPRGDCPCSPWADAPLAAKAKHWNLASAPLCKNIFLFCLPVHHRNSGNERNWAPLEFTLQIQCEKPLPHGPTDNRYTAMMWLVSFQPISHFRILSLEVLRVTWRLLMAVHGSAAGVSKQLRLTTAHWSLLWKWAGLGSISPPFPANWYLPGGVQMLVNVDKRCTTWLLWVPRSFGHRRSFCATHIFL